ncbi:MAG TPA: isoprenylcysteine carboxylmethyltransferase family protein [Dehalococcoidales bacterium]|nr:isoprenylcysteine carboxylmethyltransferase family protein [Dehalococcoidales bacterium]
MNIENQSPTHHRDDLTGEHKFGDAGQLIIAIIFLIVWILDSFILKYTTFLNSYVPLAVQITLGIIFLCAAFFMARTGMNIVFNEVRKTPGVIRKGIFSFIRHPIYLSEILFYLSLICFRISLAAVFIWFVAIAFLYFISRYEEKLLVKRFGQDYLQYMKDVPMFFPKLLRRKTRSSH